MTDSVNTPDDEETTDLDLEEVRQTLTEGDVTDQLTALQTVATRAEESPDDVTPLVPTLADVLDTDLAKIRLSTLVVLTHIAEHDPEACKPAATAVAERISLPESTVSPAEIVDDRTNPEDRNVRDAVGQTIQQSTRHRETESELALFVLVRLVEVAPDLVSDVLVPKRETLVELVESDHQRVRGLAVGLTSYVGEDDPELVAKATPALVDILDEEEKSEVRASAVWALGYANSDRAKNALERTARSDDSSEVRQIAGEVLETT